MKRILYPTLLFFTVSLVGCKKLVSFDLNFNDSVTIPANAVINIPLEIPALENQTNSEQELSNKGSSTSLISKVVLSKLDLSIVSPNSENFNFLKSINIYISGPSLAETRIAYNDNVPATDLQVLPLTCEDKDLKEYIKKDSYTITVKALTDEPLLQDTEINVNSKLTVDAGIF